MQGTYDFMKRGQVPFLTPDQVNKILVDPENKHTNEDSDDEEDEEVRADQVLNYN